MTARPWYKRYGGDFVMGTMRLTLEEKGAYSLCLDLIYDRGGPIPDDARWLAGVCGVSVRKWTALRESLIAAGKLVASDGHLSNERATREIAISSETTRKLAENGAKGGNKSAENRAEANEINQIAEAPLKPIQKPEPEERREDDKSSLPPSPADPKYPPDLEAAWRAYPHVKGRSSKVKSLVAWRKIPAKDRAGMVAAAVRYKAEGREPRSDFGAPAMDKWLKDGRYADWLAEPLAEIKPATEAETAHRLAHFRATREWKPSWGQRPKDAA